MRSASVLVQATGDPEIGRRAQKVTAQIATILYGKQGIEERKWAPAEAESIRCACGYCCMSLFPVSLLWCTAGLRTYRSAAPANADCWPCAALAGV